MPDVQLAFGDLSAAGRIALAAAAVAVAVGLWLDVRRLGRRGWTVGLLRLAAFAALAAIVARTSLRVEKPPRERTRLAVLFDTSASMALPDAPDDDATLRPRIERVQAAWTPELVRALRRNGIDVEAWRFDAAAERIEGDPAAVLADRPEGAGSDLLAALGAFDDRDDAPPPAGILVVSDGRVTADGARRGLLETARALGIPVSTVAAGAPFTRDVWIAAVHAPPFAFAENVVDIDVEVGSVGYAGRTFEVRLLEDGRVLERRTVVASDGDEPRRVRFDVAPERVGSFVYAVEVDGPDDQATADNDRRTFVLEVLRDKVRVLHVAGRPDWDVRALRILLRRDPNVELLSYYILRDLDDILRDPTPPQDLSLIPFPTDELFSEQLGSFDLVILQNFDLGRHQVGRYLPDLARYVEEGGGLVLIGGDLGIGQGGLFDPAFGKVIPVNLKLPSRFERRTVRIEPTAAGRTHPITAALAAAAAAPPGLPALSDRNRVRLAPHADAIGTRVLLEGDGTPLLVSAEPGKGRVLVLATASSWRLGFAPDLALAGGVRPYDLLWLGAVRWLLREEGSDRLAVDTDRPRYGADDPVVVEVTTLGPDYAPESGVAVEGRIVRADGAGDGPPDGGEAVARFSVTTGAFGRGRTEVTDLSPGAYAVEVHRAAPSGEAGEGEADTARHVFLVEPPRRELADVDARPGTAFLRELAEATGGAFADLSAGDPIPDRPPTRPPRDGGPAVRRQVPLWDHPAVLLLALALAAADVLVRRRRGLS